MARRSPMNERYQKHTSPSGRTRKSAAAAKPKREAGSAGGSSSSGGRGKGLRAGGGAGGRAGAKGGRSDAAARAALMNPPTPEYRKWRRIWWAVLGSAVVLSIGSWLAWRVPAYRQLGLYTLIASYALIGTALFIDLTKIRRIRQEWAASAGKAVKPEPEKSAPAKPEAEKPEAETADEATESDTNKS